MFGQNQSTKLTKCDLRKGLFILGLLYLIIRTNGYCSHGTPFSIHACNPTPTFGIRVKNFNSIQSVMAIVPPDGEELVLHHRHADS